MIGIDVSYHQGAIDWDAVARGGATFNDVRSPVQFAVIKAGGEEIGRPFTDPAFKRNWLNSRVAGIRRGCYWFMNGAAGSKSGTEEAKYFLDAIHQAGGLKAGDIVPVLDVEWPPKSGSLFEIRQLHEAIAHIVGVLGVYPMLYTGAWYWNDIRGIHESDLPARCPLWVSGYNKKCPEPPEPFGAADIWQFTDKGTVDGISGPVDLNELQMPIDGLLMQDDALHEASLLEAGR